MLSHLWSRIKYCITYPSKVSNVLIKLMCWKRTDVSRKGNHSQNGEAKAAVSPYLTISSKPWIMNHAFRRLNKKQAPGMGMPLLFYPQYQSTVPTEARPSCHHNLKILPFWTRKSSKSFEGSVSRLDYCRVRVVLHHSWVKVCCLSQWSKWTISPVQKLNKVQNPLSIS